MQKCPVCDVVMLDDQCNNINCPSRTHQMPRWKLCLIASGFLLVLVVFILAAAYVTHPLAWGHKAFAALYSAFQRQPPNW